MAPIETLRCVDDDQLIEAAVAEAAQAYTDLGCGDGGGVLLYPYEPASALALRVRDVESFLAEGEELEGSACPNHRRRRGLSLRTGSRLTAGLLNLST